MTNKQTEAPAPDRKALKRDYKKAPKQMGAYLIRNTANGKSYVGTSRDIQARMNRHLFMLRTGSEDILEMQQDWQEFGAEAFEFEMLEILEPPEHLFL